MRRLFLPSAILLGQESKIHTLIMGIICASFCVIPRAHGAGPFLAHNTDRARTDIYSYILSCPGRAKIHTLIVATLCASFCARSSAVAAPAEQL